MKPYPALLEPHFHSPLPLAHSDLLQRLENTYTFGLRPVRKTCRSSKECNFKSQQPCGLLIKPPPPQVHPHIPASVAKMKTTTPISLCLIILFAISSLCAAQEPSPPVVDRDGDALRVGTEYYVRFYIWPTGGGVGLASTSNHTCPQSVVQFIESPLGPRIYGLPVTFHPLVEPKDGVIRQGMDLNIWFEEAKTPCSESTVWKVGNLDSDGKRLITAGGELGNSVSSLFRIEIAAIGSYKFVHCPAVGLKCSAIARFSGEVNGEFSLALENSEDAAIFAVLFYKKQPESLIQLPK